MFATVGKLVFQFLCLGKVDVVGPDEVVESKVAVLFVFEYLVCCNFFVDNPKWELLQA